MGEWRGEVFVMCLLYWSRYCGWCFMLSCFSMVLAAATSNDRLSRCCVGWGEKISPVKNKKREIQMRNKTG